MKKASLVKVAVVGVGVYLAAKALSESLASKAINSAVALKGMGLIDPTVQAPCLSAGGTYYADNPPGAQCLVNGQPIGITPSTPVSNPILVSNPIVTPSTPYYGYPYQYQYPYGYQYQYPYSYQYQYPSYSYPSYSNPTYYRYSNGSIAVVR